MSMQFSRNNIKILLHLLLTSIGFTMYNLLNRKEGTTVTLGEIIRSYCTEHHMSFRQFSEKSGITSGYLSMLVNNRNPKTGQPPVPSLKTYNKVADTMGISISDILQETQKDIPSYFHVVDHAPEAKKYSAIAEAIVDKLREDEALYDRLGQASDDLTETERRLLMLFRNADSLYQSIVIELLEAHPAQKENRA